MIIIEMIYNYKFQREIIENAYKSFKDIIKENTLNHATFRVGFENKTLTFDNEEDFYSYYRKDLKMAYLYYYFENSYHFKLYYNGGNKTTNVELALPTEHDTNKVLSFFEEDCRANLLGIEDKTIDKTNSKINCSLSKQLPSCFINKSLIYDLECYLKRNSDKIGSNNLEITFKESDGNESFNSIENYKFEYFPNDLKSINLYIGDYTNNISIKFSTKRDSSSIKMQLTGDDAKESANGLVSGILKIINNFKNNNYLLHPPTPIDIFIFIILFFITIPLIALFIEADSSLIQNKPLHYALFITFTLSLFLIYGRYNPYSVFNTRKNEGYRKYFGWLTFTILEFMLVFGLGIIVKLA